MSKGFVAGFAVAALLVVALLVYRSYTVQCPCGFKYEPFTGGCVVDLNAPPCTDPGGGNEPGSQAGGQNPPGTYVSPVNPAYPPVCTLNITNCAIRHDWKAVEFMVFDGSGTVYRTPPRLPVKFKISKRDKSAGSCAKITGVDIELPVNVLTSIPLDPVGIAGSGLPLGTGAGQVRADFQNDPCRGTQTDMVVVLTRQPECLCSATFNRD
jgi:hypothetical protein